ncbi:hypothetical protein MOQ_006480 [Trypanosoma cruzi marinkellei]|uniref:Uncharacterized protein n=1 Tax=Trypanosoma cruzi marinkellei TaxID=85056 RepID=K2MRN8_TRYCR|nr:hypothetical protein MOQ_006480 [Trypanosoma cruzi marinkellei]
MSVSVWVMCAAVSVSRGASPFGEGHVAEITFEHGKRRRTFRTKRPTAADDIRGPRKYRIEGRAFLFPTTRGESSPHRRNVLIECRRGESARQKRGRIFSEARICRLCWRDVAGSALFRAAPHSPSQSTPEPRFPAFRSRAANRFLTAENFLRDQALAAGIRWPPRAAKRVTAGVWKNGATPLVGGRCAKECREARAPYRYDFVFRAPPRFHIPHRILIGKLVSMFATMSVTKLRCADRPAHVGVKRRRQIRYPSSRSAEQAPFQNRQEKPTFCNQKRFSRPRQTRGIISLPKVWGSVRDAAQ